MSFFDRFKKNKEPKANAPAAKKEVPAVKKESKPVVASESASVEANYMPAADLG